MLRSHSNDLHSDQRGMILIVAIPMAVIAIGCLWYLASVGDAILHRERLQDAADASAWESAVLHARSMNAAVTLNLVAATVSALPAAAREAEPVASRIAAALQIIDEAQRALVLASPVLASVTATANNTRFYRADASVEAAVAISAAALGRSDQARLEARADRPWSLAARDDFMRSELASNSSAQLPLTVTQLDTKSGAQPATVSNAARNGNAWLQTWSIARSLGSSRARSDQRRMNLAFPARPVAIHAPRIAFAQAEYYFDCPGAWSACEAEAAWSPRWTARMRRFERPDGAGDLERSTRVEQAFLRASAALESGLASLAQPIAPRLSARAYVAELFRDDSTARRPLIH